MMEENYKLAKWLNGELSEAELAAFQSDPNYHLYERIKAYSSDLTTSDFDENESLSKILSTQKQPVKTVSLQSNWLLRIAAVLVIGFGLYFATLVFSTENEWAENGKQTAFLLPDSSAVLLNSGSEIRYRKWNWADNRNLELTGEAYFKVAKGKKFQVRTALGNVTVLGTQFNVKVRNNRFDVTCYEGRVEVAYQDSRVILSKGQAIAFENSGKLFQESVPNVKPLWTERQIAFEKLDLKEVLDEIQRVYNVKIDTNNFDSKQLFSGIVPANDIDVALQIIATTYHLRVDKISKSHYAFQAAE